MAARGMPAHTGPIGVVLAEHEQGRAFLRTVRVNLDSAGAGSAEALDRGLAAATGYSRSLSEYPKSTCFEHKLLRFRPRGPQHAAPKMISRTGSL